MVQTLNKMVHLKYPILEIWCCHKQTNQLLPSGLKLDTKLRKVFPNNLQLTPQLCTSHSCRENIAPNFVCLFEFWPIKCKHLKLRFLASFGTCYSSQRPSSRFKCGKKLRNTSLSRFVSIALHKSLLQAKYVEYILYVNFECLFWPIKCMH